MATKWHQVSQEQHERPPHRRVADCSFVGEIYEFGKKIGEGSFGQVIEATNIKTDEKWAIKIVNKENAGKSSILLLEREVMILRKVHHEHIIKLVEVIESPKKMYLVTELCLLGELKEVLDNRGPFTETTTRHINQSLMDAIVYLHRNGIVHRDLKLENILVADESGDPKNPIFNIKLTDFGLSVVKGAGMAAMLDATCGTPVYMAPEVVQNHDYTQQCDIWSIGVILFALLSKDFPFIADTEERLYEMIKKGSVKFSGPVWANVSATAKDLIEQLLTVDPAYRLTASEVSSHPWMQGFDEITSSNFRPTNVLDMMKDFNTKHPGDQSFDEDDYPENSDLHDFNRISVEKPTSSKEQGIPKIIEQTAPSSTNVSPNVKDPYQVDNSRKLKARKSNQSMGSLTPGNSYTPPKSPIQPVDSPSHRHRTRRSPTLPVTSHHQHVPGTRSTSHTPHTAGTHHTGAGTSHHQQKKQQHPKATASETPRKSHVKR